MKKLRDSGFDQVENQLKFYTWNCISQDYLREVKTEQSDKEASNECSEMIEDTSECPLSDRRE